MRRLEIARFASLTEAQIAAGALRSAGFDVQVCDTDLGSVDYLMHQALGGFRLTTPEAERQEAKAMLVALQAEAPPRQAHPTGGRLRALTATLLSFGLGLEAGFLMAKARGRLPED